MRQINTSLGSYCRHYLFSLVFMLVDYVAIVLSQELAVTLRGLFADYLHTTFVLPVSYEFIYVPLMFIIIIGLADGYKFNRPSIDILRDVCRGILVAFIISILVMFFISVTGKISRLYVLLFLVILLIVMAVLRNIAGSYLKQMASLKEPLLLLGAGKTAEGIIRFFNQDNCYRYRIVGVLDDHPISDTVTKVYPLLGNLGDAVETIKKTGVQTILFATPGIEKEKFHRLLDQVQPNVRNILFAPDIIGTPTGSVKIQSLFSEQILLLKCRNNLARQANRFVKRCFDLILCVASLPVLLPVLGVLAIIVKLDSPGPAFFNAERLGQNGEKFTCFKFRSMYVDGDAKLQGYLDAHPEAAKEWKEFAKLRGYDPRVTQAGAFMRKTSLDELPQFINVILGDMSLVGPRPYLPREQADIGNNLSVITMAKPGITGFWQVNGRNDVTFISRVTMDVWYVKNWSVWMDIYYLWKTMKIVFTGRGAY